MHPKVPFGKNYYVMNPAIFFVDSEKRDWVFLESADIWHFATLETVVQATLSELYL